MFDDQDGRECMNCFFWYWPTRVVLDKGPLNGFVCVCGHILPCSLLAETCSLGG